MLTKDLLLFRRQKNRLKPSFLDTSDWRHLKFAEQLLSIYSNSISLTKSEVDEQTTILINANRNLKLAKGLNKLCLDRSEFSKPGDYDYPALRKQLFLASSKLIAKAAHEDYHDYQMEVYRKTEDIQDFVQGSFYSDLPQNEELTKFKNLSPLHLLERYNNSLVQSLLLHSGKLEIEIIKPDAQKLRRLFKYLKFFRLLAEIKCTGLSKKNIDKAPSKVTMLVDGPISLFENTSKYGLQLACFFPALPDLDNWKIFAEIKLNNAHYELKLDHKSGLVSHYRNFSSYVPEEIRLFHTAFKDKSEEWEIIGQTPFINVGEGEVIFPDLSFKNKKGKVVHLELFHRWHMSQIVKRLDQISLKKFPNLILGVDRSLINKGGLKETLEETPWFQERGFLFRDFPGVATVLKLLKKISK
ncbi:MAG: DUF790 family protein [Lentisphaeraceae bacterium]|nr:DUF790 family protein [Lentisphaeraceae bacterium]